MRNDRKRILEIIIQATAVALIVLLIVLTGAVIAAFGRSNLTSGNVPFNLDMLTADKKSNISEIDGYLTPEFIGLSFDGEKYGISTSSNIVSELYTLISPALSELIAEGNFSKADSALWDTLAENEKFVYVRYHAQITDNIIGMFADASSGVENNDRDRVLAYVYELFLIPTRSRGGLLLATRSSEGEVAFFEGESLFDYDKFSNTALSYRSSFTRFVFAGEKFSSRLSTEPVFIDPIATREVMLSSNTGMFVFNNDSYREALMRLFSINPDKLLSEHEDPDGSISYADVHGMLYLRMSGFEYQSTSDGGVAIEKIIGYTEKIGVREYVRTSVELISQLRSINKFFVGNDADAMFYSVEASDGRVKITYEYALDNVRITGDSPAFVAEFENGKLVYAKTTAVAAKTLLSRVNSYSESWFFGTLESGIVPLNVSLVYESDYKASSVLAKWAAFVPTDE